MSNRQNYCKPSRHWIQGCSLFRMNCSKTIQDFSSKVSWTKFQSQQDQTELLQILQTHCSEKIDASRMFRMNWFQTVRICIVDSLLTLFIISCNLNVIYNDQGSVRARFSFQKGQRQTKEAQMFQLGGGGIGINCFSISSNASASWCETHRSKVFKICMETWNKLDVQSILCNIIQVFFSRISRFEEFSKLNSWGEKTELGLSSSLWGEKLKFLPFKGCASKPLCWISCRPGILIYWQKYLFDIWMKYFSTILERILIYWKISLSLTSNETLLCQVPKKK